MRQRCGRYSSKADIEDLADELQRRYVVLVHHHAHVEARVGQREHLASWRQGPRPHDGSSSSRVVAREQTQAVPGRASVLQLQRLLHRLRHAAALPTNGRRMCASHRSMSSAVETMPPSPAQALPRYDRS